VGLDPALIYRDEHLAVFVKPPGLLSVAAPRRGREPNLVSLAARVLGEAHPVHRLDEPTSGLILVARTADARQALIPLFGEHAIDRRYLALVNKTFPAEPRTVDNSLVADRGDGRRGAGEGAGAVRAVTHLRRRQVLVQDASVVEARLETGRTHQVRVHLSEAGFPVLGDRRYGGPRVERRAPRLALHAWRLAFTHPLTGQPLRFEAPLADDLERLRRTLDGEEDPGQRPPERPRERPRGGQGSRRPKRRKR
jgi:23S rRNA pseudouridine1911/1915/1917 synthase